MTEPQHLVLADVVSQARFMEFVLEPGGSMETLSSLGAHYAPESTLVGIGPALTHHVGSELDSMRHFPALSGPRCTVPSTQADLWVLIGGDDRGTVANRGRALLDFLSPAFRVTRLVDGFKHREGRDLTGYEDGTENPVGDEARAAAVVTSPVAGLDGSSFVAVQQWKHDLRHFESLSQTHRDHIIGRRLSDNEELDDAPASAHVKRTAPREFRSGSLCRQALVAVVGRQRRRAHVRRLWSDVGRFLRFSFGAWSAKRMALPMACSSSLVPSPGVISGAHRWPTGNSIWPCSSDNSRQKDDRRGDRQRQLRDARLSSHSLWLRPPDPLWDGEDPENDLISIK